MTKRVLCRLGWHKWSEKKYSLKYFKWGRWYQAVSVCCLRCGCTKEIEGRV